MSSDAAWSTGGIGRNHKDLIVVWDCPLHQEEMPLKFA